MNDKRQDPRTHRNPEPVPCAKDDEATRIREAKGALEKSGTRNQFKRSVSDDDRKTNPL